MNSLSDLTNPFLDVLLDHMQNFMIDRRLKKIDRDIEVLEKSIANDLEAISELTKEGINLRNQFFLPKGMHL